MAKSRVNAWEVSFSCDHVCVCLCVCVCVRVCAFVASIFLWKPICESFWLCFGGKIAKGVYLLCVLVAWRALEILLKMKRKKAGRQQKPLPTQ